MDTTDTSPITGAEPKTDVPAPAIGRPPHIKTRRMSRLVEGMVANGIAHEQIAQLLEISADTLTKYYRKELDTGESKAVALMARSLYRRGLKGDTVAALFWLKAKGKWRDRDPMNVSVAQILPNSDVPKLDSRQVEDAIYTALSRMRPNAKQQPALLEHNQ